MISQQLDEKRYFQRDYRIDLRSMEMDTTMAIQHILGKYSTCTAPTVFSFLNLTINSRKAIQFCTVPIMCRYNKCSQDPDPH